MKKENKQLSMLNNLNMTSLKIFQLRSKSFLKFKVKQSFKSPQ